MLNTCKYVAWRTRVCAARYLVGNFSDSQTDGDPMNRQLHDGLKHFTGPAARGGGNARNVDRITTVEVASMRI